MFSIDSIRSVGWLRLVVLSRFVGWLVGWSTGGALAGPPVHPHFFLSGKHGYELIQWVDILMLHNSTLGRSLGLSWWPKNGRVSMPNKILCCFLFTSQVGWFHLGTMIFVSWQARNVMGCFLKHAWFLSASSLFLHKQFKPQAWKTSELWFATVRFHSPHGSYHRTGDYLRIVGVPSPESSNKPCEAGDFWLFFINKKQGTCSTKGPHSTLNGCTHLTPGRCFFQLRFP